MAQGARVLIDHLNLFSALPDIKVQEVGEDEEEEVVDTENDLLRRPIEDLDLSLRSYNCLKRAGIHLIDDIVSKDVSELAKIRNFGKKSFAEVREKIEALGLEFQDRNHLLEGED